jgi:L,D-peptidoglycan transpeptidase YkuD (ErfK/YbiS/YcfS/YnhG family)
VITVVASGTTATLQRWSKASGGWVKVGPAMFAYVGEQGVTNSPREGYAGTPAGSWTLTQAFGRYAKPAGTALPYFKTDSLDWWDGDSASPTYSTHQRCAQSACTFRTSESENLYYVGQPYNYAVVIDYNTPNSPTGARPGKGSAFFLHVANGMPTAGCVSVSEANMKLILDWLNPLKHPRILIGT